MVEDERMMKERSFLFMHWGGNWDLQVSGDRRRFFIAFALGQLVTAVLVTQQHDSYGEYRCNVRRRSVESPHNCNALYRATGLINCPQNCGRPESVASRVTESRNEGGENERSNKKQKEQSSNIRTGCER
jgi:hypothetical protein